MKNILAYFNVVHAQDIRHVNEWKEFCKSQGMKPSVRYTVQENTLFLILPTLLCQFTFPHEGGYHAGDARFLY